MTKEEVQRHIDRARVEHEGVSNLVAPADALACTAFVFVVSVLATLFSAFEEYTEYVTWHAVAGACIDDSVDFGSACNDGQFIRGWALRLNDFYQHVSSDDAGERRGYKDGKPTPSHSLRMSIRDSHLDVDSTDEREVRDVIAVANGVHDIPAEYQRSPREGAFIESIGLASLFWAGVMGISCLVVLYVGAYIVLRMRVARYRRERAAIVAALDPSLASTLADAMAGFDELRAIRLHTSADDADAVAMLDQQEAALKGKMADAVVLQSELHEVRRRERLRDLSHRFAELNATLDGRLDHARAVAADERERVEIDEAALHDVAPRSDAA